VATVANESGVPFKLQLLLLSLLRKTDFSEKSVEALLCLLHSGYLDGAVVLFEKKTQPDLAQVAAVPLSTERKKTSAFETGAVDLSDAKSRIEQLPERYQHLFAVENDTTTRPAARSIPHPFEDFELEQPGDRVYLVQGDNAFPIVSVFEAFATQKLMLVTRSGGKDLLLNVLWLSVFLRAKLQDTDSTLLRAELITWLSNNFFVPVSTWSTDSIAPMVRCSTNQNDEQYLTHVYLPLNLMPTAASMVCRKKTRIDCPSYKTFGLVSFDLLERKRLHSNLASTN
jgi:hypothetical protein